MWSMIRADVGSKSWLTIWPSDEEQHPVGVGRRDGVVGDHHDGLAEVDHGLAHEAEDLGAGPRVEVAGGLVGEDDLRLARPGPGPRPRAAAGRRTAREGRWVRRSPRPTVRTTESIHSSSCFRPARSSGRVMFSIALSVGTRLNGWKTNPTWSRRTRVRALSSSCVRSVSPMNTWPERDASRGRPRSASAWTCRSPTGP